MTLYIEKGFTSGRLEAIKEKPMQYLVDYQAEKIARFGKVNDAQASKLRDKMESQKAYTFTDEEWQQLTYLDHKKQEMRYFTSGYIEPNENGTNKRSDSSLLRRDVFILDYDDLNIDYDTFVESVTSVFEGLELIIYPTIKYHDKHPRMRLILPIDRPLVKYEYLYMMKEIASKIPYPYDSASFTWAQCMGLPVITPFNQHRPLYHQTGAPYPTPLKIEPPNKPTQHNHTAINATSNEIITAFTEYVEWDKDNLMDYNKALHALLVLVKTYQEGSIDIDTLYQCAEILAMGNGAWVEGNYNIIRANLDRVVRTNWTFKSKFIDLRSKPQTLADLYQLLQLKGEEWREEHTKVNEKTGETKTPPVSPRAIANILKKECHFCLIDESDPELALLAVYDPDSGIYRKGERFINKLILAVEATTVKSACDTVRHFLTVEGELKKRTEDRALIVFNNGIYDRVIGDLIDFSPDYVFTSKVNVNYVENAREPTFKDWSFSQWIKELSDNVPEKELLLWQIMGNALDANNITGVSVFFYSRKGNTGKSTFQELLSSMIGKENVASLKIKEFEDDFKLASAYGKSLIIGDDNNPSAFHETSENFKSVVTGDNVLINPKGDKPFLYYFNSLVVQSMNGLPRFKDVSHGTLRRIRVFFFNHQYQGDTDNKRVKNEYIHDKRLHEYIAYKALQVDSTHFIDTKESQEAIKGIELDNNPVLQFYEEVVTELNSTRLPVKFLFQYFIVWTKYELNNQTKIKQNTFTNEMKPIMESDGWEYSRNNHRPGEQWLESDLSGFDNLRSFNDPAINLTELKYKIQPLFVK